MPWQFRLVERDSSCLNEEQQAQVRQLQLGYEQRLIRVLCPVSSLSEPALQAAGHAIASLLNNAPGWLQHHPLPPRERERLLHSLLAGAIERLLADNAPLQVHVA